jgi:MFS family permease
MTIGTDSERAPLLGPGDANRRTDFETNPPESDTASTALPPATKLISPAKRILVLALSFTLLITLAIGGALLNVPIAEIQEEIICRRIHGPDFDPGKCKDKNVQSELSLIRGWDTTFTLIPSFLTSVPYGAVADRYGRTLVLGLSLFGITLNAMFGSLVCAMPHVFHLRTVWLGSIIQFVGGGEIVFSAMIYTIVADISTEEQRFVIDAYNGHKRHISN